MTKSKQQMNIVIAGHVDHGKSTVIGRMLADTNSLPEGKLEQVKANCEKNSKPFEYAFLLDALKDEQSQGITIDAARVFFGTEKRDYIILDAPGHIEFLKNMITGASRAECALLVIDANEGVQENSRRHGYMMAMLGIKQFCVIINKMDLVDYNQESYNLIVKEYSNVMSDININATHFVPASGMMGDNIASLSENMKWYNGLTVLDSLDNFQKETEGSDKPFRMPVQDVYKFTKYGDDRRIIAGTVDTGNLNVGDEVVFYPSGKKSKVKSFEKFNGAIPESVTAGEAIGFTMTEQIYVKRGEMAAKFTEKAPKVTTRIIVSLFWLGKKPMELQKEYLFKLGTSKIMVKIEEIKYVLDASNLNNDNTKTRIDRHDVAECILKLKKPIAFDLAEEISKTSRFVIIDEYEIRGGGIIREALPDKQSQIREQVLLRNYKWEKSIIPPHHRAERYNQKSVLVLLTGNIDVGKKPIAKALEKKLFNDGKYVYYLGIGNVKYGVDADIASEDKRPDEHIRRFSEVSYLLIDSGTILIATARGLTQDNLEVMKAVIDSEKIITIWVGENITTDLTCDYHLTETENPEEAASILKELLQDKGVLFRPW